MHFFQEAAKLRTLRMQQYSRCRPKRFSDGRPSDTMTSPPGPSSKPTTRTCRSCLVVGSCAAALAANVSFIAGTYMTLRHQGSADILFATTASDVVRGPLFDVAPETQDLSQHVAALRSASVADAVIQTLRLQSHAEFSGDGLRGWLKSWRDDDGAPRASAEALQRTRARLARALVVAEGGNASIRITFKGKDPALAMAIVNAVAGSYAASLRQPVTTAPVADTSDLDREIATARANVEVAEQAVAAARADEDLTAARQVAADDESSRLHEVLAQVEDERVRAEARAKAARDAIAAGRADTVLDERASPLARQLTQTRASLQDTLSRMSKTLPPHHARLQELSADLSRVDHQLAAQAVQLAERLDADVDAVKARENDLRRKLKSAKGRSTAQPNRALEEASRVLDERRGALTDLLASRSAAIDNAAAAPPPPRPPPVVLSATKGVPVFDGLITNVVLSLLVALVVFAGGYRLAQRQQANRG